MSRSLLPWQCDMALFVVWDMVRSIRYQNVFLWCNELSRSHRYHFYWRYGFQLIWLSELSRPWNWWLDVHFGYVLCHLSNNIPEKLQNHSHSKRLSFPLQCNDKGQSDWFPRNTSSIWKWKTFQRIQLWSVSVIGLVPDQGSWYVRCLKINHHKFQQYFGISECFHNSSLSPRAEEIRVICFCLFWSAGNNNFSVGQQHPFAKSIRRCQILGDVCHVWCAGLGKELCQNKICFQTFNFLDC